jgi:nucleotide-binding universal stress UspA family protein
MACRLRARVTVLFVVATTGQDAAVDEQHPSHAAVDVGERVFRRVRRMAAKTGVPCVCRYAFGRDAHAIVREAAIAHQCDLVVFNGP